MCFLPLFCSFHSAASPINLNGRDDIKTGGQSKMESKNRSADRRIVCVFLSLPKRSHRAITFSASKRDYKLSVEAVRVRLIAFVKLRNRRANTEFVKLEMATKRETERNAIGGVPSERERNTNGKENVLLSRRNERFCISSDDYQLSEQPPYN